MRRLLIITLSGLLCAMFSLAQDVEVLDYKDIFHLSFAELMNVKISTADKTPDAIKDIPASVVLITRNEIETFGYQTLEEVLESIPGLYKINDYTDEGDKFGVRGFWSGVANDNMVILVNGVSQINDFYSNYSLMKIPIEVEAIDRIEIIRGPMSVIYGNGAFYGAINIITNEIDQNILSISSGTFNTKKFFGRVAEELDEFKYSFNISYSKNDGIDYPIRKLMTNPSELLTFGLSEDATLKNKLDYVKRSACFSGKFREFTFEAGHAVTEQEGIFSIPSFGDGSKFYMSTSRFQGQYKKSISEKMDVVGKVSFSQIRDSYSFDFLFEDFFGNQIIEANAWEVELNAFYNVNENLDFTGGLLYRSLYHADNKYDLASFPVPTLKNNHEFLAEGDRVVTQALYGQFDYKASDVWKFTAGARLEQSPRYDIIANRYVEGEPFFKVNATYDKEKIEFMPRFAAIYSPDRNNSFKFLYGKAINRTSFFQNSKNAIDPDAPDLKPEDIETFEFNYLAALSSSFSVNLSLFNNVLDHLVTRIVIVDNSGAYKSWSANAGKLITNGVELTLKGEPFDNLRVELSGILQNTKDKRPSFKNIDVAYSPKSLFYFKTSYRKKSWSIAFTGNYVDKMETYWKQLNEFGDGLEGRIGETVDGYLTIGANLRVNNLFVNNLYLNVRCSNLLDQEIFYPTYTNNDWADKGTLGRGRACFVNVGMKF